MNRLTVSTFLILLLFVNILFLSRAEAFTLSVTNKGAGAGNINGDVTCNIDPLGQCSVTSQGGTVTLTAVADWKAIFDGWGTPCSGTGSCIFTLLADTDVAVTFAPNFQAIIVGHDMAPNYTTLADAYAHAGDQYIVAANVYTFHEDLVLDTPKLVRFYLGKDPGFYGFPAIGFTTIQGSLTVKYGAVEIDSLIIQ